MLRVLGVLKVAIADHIQRLASPHLTYRHTLKDTAAKRKEARTASHRGAANDLRRHGLSVDGGRTRGGGEVRLLTKDGLAAAAIDLDCEPEEMGGMPKSAGRSGASHPMAVNETVIALIRPKPDLVAGEPAEAVAAAQAAAGRQHARPANQLHQLLPVRHGTDVGYSAIRFGHPEPRYRRLLYADAASVLQSCCVAARAVLCKRIGFVRPGAAV
ncbi:hypothetical protein ABT126_37290 [Streptomyces sp. NPDC002012]|uniref:hypothetical protein n=1 Tax=Streptomyces sp. NPDC002012 TaxID=3154532 RepID=UPI003323EB0D